MDKADLNFLKELAKACRKAGIASFKGHGVEFELGDIPSNKKTTSPTKSAKKKKVVLSTPDGDIETDAPTDAEILYWSVGGDPDSENSNQGSEQWK